MKTQMKTKINAYLILAAVVAALGGLLFGFDTAVISGTTPFLQPYFQLTDISLGWAVSSLLVGAIIGVISAGKPGDFFGRRKTLMVAALLFTVSAFGSALSTHLWVFIIFRFAGGLAVGTASMLSPMYISEISPSNNRGQLVSLNQLAIVVGILVAFFSNYLLADIGENNWRWMLAVMGLPSLLFLFALVFVPESPRWLVQKGKNDEALDVLQKINGKEIAIVELASIRETIATETKATLGEVFSPKVRPILWIGILLAIFQQATGINSIMYYAPIIFQKTGAGISSALTQTIMIGGINLLFTIVAIWLIDKVGRKPLLIAGTIGMIVSLTSIAIAFFMDIFEGYVLLTLVLVYIASFAVALGPVTWVVISEIFPNKLRSMAMSVAIVSLWTACFIVTLTFPVMLNRLGGGVSFLIFDALCILLLVFVLVKIPETKGKSLEELEKLLYKN
jgi:MFS transporter, SP family, arabinose:H+ symporter